MATIKKREMVLAIYTRNPNASFEDALVKAGYSKKRAAITASEWRHDPEFIAALERKQSRITEKQGVS